MNPEDINTIVGPWGLAVVLVAMMREHLKEMRVAVRELAAAVRTLSRSTEVPDGTAA